MAKFRSWNDKLNCFIYFDNGKYSVNGDWVGRNPKGTFNWQNAEQSTGLKDINSKEIFVGDKVAVYDFKAKGTVVFYDCFGVEMDNGLHCLSFNDIVNKDIYIEVIGNIHENKELLKNFKTLIGEK